MKNIFSRFILISSAVILYAIPAFACPRASLEGAWSRSVPEKNVPDNGTTYIWVFHGDRLESTTQLTDDLTASGSSGPYAESETIYAITFDEATCTLRGEADRSTFRTLRNYAEPYGEKSSATTGGRRILRLKTEFSSDGNRVTFHGAKEPIVFTRKL